VAKKLILYYFNVPKTRFNLHIIFLARTAKWFSRNKVSISLTFCLHLFQSKVFSADFCYLLFGFVIFLQKNIAAKAAHKMLVKLTTGVNFTNILHAAFCTCRSQTRKKILTTGLNSSAFGSYKRKSCS
jgi:hypothetical protein